MKETRNQGNKELRNQGIKEARHERSKESKNQGIKTSRTEGIDESSKQTFNCQYICFPSCSESRRLVLPTCWSLNEGIDNVGNDHQTLHELAGADTVKSTREGFERVQGIFGRYLGESFPILPL